MSKENKMADTSTRALAAEMMGAFETYKQANDARLADLEKKGASDPLLDEKLSRLDRRLDQLCLKAAAPQSAAEPETHSVNEAWEKYLRRGDETGLARLDTKALNASNDAQGGYVAPPELDRLIESRLMQASPMRQIASIRQTSSGVFRKPVSLGVGARWVSETEARTETPVADLSLLEFPAGELYAMPAATQTLLDDAYADIDAWLADEVETAFSTQESAAFIHGDGNGKPRGLLTYPFAANADQSWGQLGLLEGDLDATSASDLLIDLVHAPKTPFRTGARFVMNRSTLATVRKLKDTLGQYIWAPGQDGGASTLLGYPVTEIEDMPDAGAGEPCIAFGDFRRGYLIVDRQGAQVLRDPYSAKPYVLFYTTKRVGGGIQNFDAIKLLRA